MQFITRRRRQSPTVIIISLIDVLIVVLIFLIVTTTFKQQPAIALALPESSQPKPGSSPDALEVTISKQGVLYLKKDPVTLAKLQEGLLEAAHANASTTLSIRADTEAPFGQVIKVMDAAKSAKLSTAHVYVQKPGSPGQ